MANKSRVINHLSPKISSFNPQLWVILILGFSSGLPFLLTLSTLSFWLAESEVNKTIIGIFMLISLPYSFKFMWAPILDRVVIPFLGKKLGQRRSWAFVMQMGLITSIIWLGFSSPSEHIWSTAIAAFFVSFFSASQDIIYDAYRIEIISDTNRGIAAALENVGFRVGMLASGAGALYLASIFDWQVAYHLMALAMTVGVITVLVMPEPQLNNLVVLPVHSLHLSFMQRFKAFFLQPWQQFSYRPVFLYLFFFIFCFKVADIVLNSMSVPFLCDLGVSKVEFANISKVFGITLMVIGGLLGGLIIHRFELLQSVILSTLLQGMCCLMFAVQALVGYDSYVLMITVGAESLCSGLTATVFLAYISGFCSKPHTATHFTLLCSIGSFARVIISAGAGWLADHVDWSILFLFSGLAIVPTIFLALKIDKYQSFDGKEILLKQVA